jgi:hypothetical protein
MGKCNSKYAKISGETHNDKKIIGGSYDNNKNKNNYIKCYDNKNWYCYECNMSYNKKYYSDIGIEIIHCCRCKKNYDYPKSLQLYQYQYNTTHCCECKMIYDEKTQKHCCDCKKNYPNNKTHCCDKKFNNDDYYYYECYSINKNTNHCIKCYYNNDNLCPITCLPIKEKCMLECKHIFEKSAIMDWIKINNNCPLCRCNIDYNKIK